MTSRKEKGGERMKHVQMLSSEKPMKAEETAWVWWKNLFPAGLGGQNLQNQQMVWLVSRVDQWLQK